MASTSRPATATSTPRRKSSGAKEKSTMIVTLKVSPLKLKSIVLPFFKDDSPSKDSVSTTSNTLPVAASSNGDNPNESSPNTPAPNGTPVPTSMPPPTEAIKKRSGGVKRTSTAALGVDGLARVRGKPGPKKKARLDDGTIDPAGSTPRTANLNGGSHRLGPKANQGAINAGLRALDRSGKPCRKWEKRSFVIKTFTGQTIEIPRWKAPPKIVINPSTEGSTSGDSSKENKDLSQVQSEKSNSAPDAESATQLMSSPAPQAPTVAASA
ncbi:hypothetical protein CJF30_00000080 [Rutstroemia sp. NJR-2017a BBW]|nr:hypothetical protein CJF30_00000080 [Rutstroemia sp. NJR-2017a BBW]